MGWLTETLGLARARYSAILLTSALAILPASLLGSGAVRFVTGLLGGGGAETRLQDASGKDLLISRKGSSPELRARESPKVENAVDLRALLTIAAAVTVGVG